MNRNTQGKLLGLLFCDLLIIGFSISITFLILRGWHLSSDERMQLIGYILITCTCCAVSMKLHQLYRRVWQYASVGEIIGITRAVVIGSLVSYVLYVFLFKQQIPLLVALASMETMLLMMGGTRFTLRVFTNRRKEETVGTTEKVLIIGAGYSGTIIAREIMHRQPVGVRVIGFIDDDPRHYKMRVLGIPVLGTRQDIEAVVAEQEIDQILIAIPSAPKQEISEIVNLCKSTGAKLRILPALNDLIRGKVSYSQMRDVSVEDLLGREVIHSDLEGIAHYITDKVVLVTGAGGSIGSELCRQIAAFMPSKLLLLGHGENSIYTIEQELRGKFPELPLESLIADIQDRSRLEVIFKGHLPQVVFHAAAHKHVPLMEINPSEAVKNNVLGTKNVADCADRYEVERFVFISTDKAVNPTSVMGATKRIAEMYIQSMGAQSSTIFATVRFGNVLGSRGSVIPRFKEQLAKGGPLTVTHPDMMRYFMTIPEAVQLVIQAGAFASGGEIFVLDMGEPVRIRTLAEDLIRLSGYEPYVDIGIEYTGIRDGEKMYEELLSNEESRTATQHNRIFIGQLSHINKQDLELQIKRLEKVLSEDYSQIRSMLEKMVSTYKHVS